MCPICNTPHWSRQPHDFGKITNADIGKAPQGGKRTPGRSGDSSSFRIPAQAGGKPAKDLPVKRERRRGRPAGRDGSVPPGAVKNTSMEGQVEFVL